ncbi:MAG: hypothetical protein ACW99G_09840 [Candidatus Thorarchaeota archaeon]|jgi:hypothetical protein
MRYVELFSRLLFVIGVSLLAMSFLFPAGISVGINIDPGHYEGTYFLVTDDIYFETTIRFGSGTFSIYFLESDDVIQVLESGTMIGIDPLFAMEDIEEYEGWLHFPESGTYGFVATHSHNDTIILRIWGIALPRFSFIYPGIVLSLPFVIVSVFNIYQKRRRTLKKGEL